MNYSGLIKADMANGIGVRVTLFVSGCELRCPECHSEKLWDYENGLPFDENAKNELFDAVDHPWISGITLSGGHPLAERNLADTYHLIMEFRNRFPDKNVWLYTGLTLDKDMFAVGNESLMSKTLRACDVVVDGSYMKELRDTTIAFRGSTNQRLIDVKRTVASGSIMEVRRIE